MTKSLAIHGGVPIRTEGWAKWPQYASETLEMLQNVLESRRWAISGPFVGTELYEKKFAKAFADFCSAKYCVPCDHGSSALLIALEALDIGFGDEVIIPALTWIATATAVVNVNAIPVLVDIDPVTLCIDPEGVEAAITPRTKAIMPVHLYSGMCDMDRLLAISHKYNIPIIEDCAHVHGAKWGDHFAGTMGKVGAFSFQQGKGLTSGEGGCVLTNDVAIYDRLQELRADSRKYMNQHLNTFDMEVVLGGNVQGTNFCLSEFHSAILLSQMNDFKKNINKKIHNANYLDQLLTEVGGIAPLSTYPPVQQRAYYCYVVRIQPMQFGEIPSAEICKLLKAELNIPFFSPYEPLNIAQSYNPATKKRNQINQEHLERLDFRKYELSVTQKAYQECICMPHWVLLGNEKDMKDIQLAYQKIKNHVSPK